MKYVHPPDNDYAAQLIIEALEENKDSLSELQIHKLTQRAEQIQKVRKYRIDQLLHDTLAGLGSNIFENYSEISVDAQIFKR